MSVSVHFHSIQAELQRKLARAQVSISVAVAWFTDEQIFETLLERIAAGVTVVVVIRNDVVNLHARALTWQRLLDAGGTLYFTPEQPALHHKFCVVDGQLVLTGSYNWTYGARRNRENLLTIEQPEVVNAFLNTFRELLDESREVASIQQTALQMPPLAEPDLQHQAEAEIRFRQEEATLGDQAHQYEELASAGNNGYMHKHYAQAEELLRRALLIKPHGAEAYHLLAEVYWRTERFEESIEASQRAQVHGMQGAGSWNALGLAYQGLQQYHQAVKCYDKGIELDKTESALYRNKFIAQNQAKQLKAADATALVGGQIAAAAIREYRKSGNTARLLTAYLDRAFLHSDLPEARKYARLAQEQFDQLPESERDWHDLDDISQILAEKLV